MKSKWKCLIQYSDIIKTIETTRHSVPFTKYSITTVMWSTKARYQHLSLCTQTCANIFNDKIWKTNIFSIETFLFFTWSVSKRWAYCKRKLSKRSAQGERTLNGMGGVTWWRHYERKVNALWTIKNQTEKSGERKTVNGERTEAHGEWMLIRESRTFKGLYYVMVAIQWLKDGS